MNSKSARKLRQIHRKHVNFTAHELVQKYLKPKPRFLPWFVWLFLIGLVMKIDK